MNEHRFVVSDSLWQRFEPRLPGKVSDSGATAKDNRKRRLRPIEFSVAFSGFGSWT